MAHFVHSSVVAFAQLFEPINLIQGDLNLVARRKLDTTTMNHDLVFEIELARLGVDNIGILFKNGFGYIICRTS